MDQPTLITERSQQYLTVARTAVLGMLALLAHEAESRRVCDAQVVLDLREVVYHIDAAKRGLALVAWTGIDSDANNRAVPLLEGVILRMLFLRDRRDLQQPMLQIAIDACGTALAVRSAALRFQVFECYADRQQGSPA